MAGKNPLFGKPDRITKRISLLHDIASRTDALSTSWKNNDNNFTSIIKDSYLENVFFSTKEAADGSDVIFLEKRPGLATQYIADTQVFSTLATAGTTTWINSILSGLEGQVRVSGPTPALLNTSGAASGRYVLTLKETKVGTTPNILAQEASNTVATFAKSFQFTNTNTWWYAADGAAAFTQITDADFPTDNIGDMIELDGYHFIGSKAGNIYNSDLNSISSWPATGFLPTGFNPDDLIGIARYKNTIVAFSKQSMEFFENVGNPTGSPLQRIPHYAKNYGIVSSLNTGSGGQWHGRPYIEAFDTVFFVAYGINNKYSGVYKIEDYSPVKISTPFIEELARQAIYGGGTANTISLQSAFSYNGFSYLLVNIRDYSFIYCLELKKWVRLSSYVTSTTRQGFTYIINSQVTSTGGPLSYLMGKTTSGTTYYFQPTSTIYDDFGTSAPIHVVIQTTNKDLDSYKLKRFHTIRFLGAQSAATCSVSWTDDDYQTFSTSRTVDMSKKKPKLEACGSANKRAFKIESNDTNYFGIFAIEIDFSECEY